MAEETPYDIAMKFVLEGGGKVLAESTLQIHPDDVFMKDFKATKSTSEYSNFFEVDSFDISMTNEPDDGEGAAGAAKGGARGGAGARPGPALMSRSAGLLMTGPAGRGAAAPADPAAANADTDGFHRWRSATEAEAKKMSFQLHFDSFKFTRFVDGASPSFFQNCARQVKFESAALVKRFSLGAGHGGERIPKSFMRFEFKKVMLKSVSWEDGDLVKETIEFTCDWFSFQYRKQKPEGDFEAPGAMTTWDRERDSARKKEDRNNGR